MAISPVNVQVRDKDKASTIDKINTGLGMASTILGAYGKVSPAAATPTQGAVSTPAPMQVSPAAATPTQGAVSTPAPMPEINPDSVDRWNQKYFQN